jgi:dCTP deaminase
LSILPDHEIRRLALEQEMISPFSETLKQDGVISHGLSSFGYDSRVAPEFKIFTNPGGVLIDPKNFDDSCLVTKVSEEAIVLPANSFALARTVEYFKIPDDVLVICLGKSSYARCGIVVNVTPLEPGWEGHVTLEFSNTTPTDALIYPNEGACQFLFFRGESACELTYAMRGGKYQGQTGITLPRIKKSSDAAE